MRQWIVCLIFLIFSSTVYSQTYLFSGIIKDSLTQKPLSFANVSLIEITKGVSTDKDGKFKFNSIKNGNYTLAVSFLGYERKLLHINLNSNTQIIVKLLPKSILLDETIIQSSTPTFRKTPIAFSNIESKNIENGLGGRDVGFILEKSPNIYISSQGGGIGDYRIAMRGFDHTNVAVMLNGVPVNNLENGQIYWSNWLGISDVLESIQVQRGLGANPFSVSAVGGVINFQTKSIANYNNFIKVNFEIGSDNFTKTNVAFSNNLFSNGLRFTGLISKKNWDGYADQTWVDEFTYYFAIGGIFNHHSIEMQFIGSPQKHGQRLTMLTLKEWEKYGKQYNADWGYLNGEALNLRDNVFHKPTINLNHNWQIDKDLLMSNVVYYSYGDGGGTVPPWAEFKRTLNGLIDFDSEWEKNSKNIDPTYHSDLKYTGNALRFTVHKHNWLGMISNVRIKINNFDISVGVDGRYYSAQNYREVDNLLGGDYTIGSSNINIDPTKLLFKGDKIDYNADSFVKQLGGFVQIENEFDDFTIYTNLSASNTGFKRIDYFNFLNSDVNRETDWENIFGFTIKTGLNYNIDKSNNVYANFGYFSKAPLAEHVYDYSNNKYKNIKNEKILSLEVGYGFSANNFNLNSNTFITSWKDKAISRNIVDVNTNKLFYYNISGASARHMGIELELLWKPFTQLSLNGIFSYSVNKWINNVNAIVVPESDPTQQTAIDSYVKDVYVGGFPMSQIYLTSDYRFDYGSNTKVFIQPVFRFLGNQYAQFDPESRTDKQVEEINSWRLPDFSLIDFHSGLIFIFNNSFLKRLNISIHLFNALNNNSYITDAVDGVDHSKETAKVWFGRERWWSLSTSLEF